MLFESSVPAYEQVLPLDNLTEQQFLVIAIEVAKKLEWEIQHKSEKGLMVFTNKGIHLWNANITIRIEDNTVHLKSESAYSEKTDAGMNKITINKFINNFRDLKETFTEDDLSQKYEEIKPEFIPSGQDVLSQPPRTVTEKLTNFLSIFIPKKGNFITAILVDLNIAVFILMAISGVNVLLPDNYSLLKWGANFRPVTLQGEWWRLVSNCFLHIGIVHLLMNMYALLYVGILLEPILGKLRFTVAYLLTGIVASINSLYWHDLTISAGASGAIFGMYGVFLAMLTTNLIEKSARGPLLTSIAIFVGYNLLNGMKGGIDNAAHIGGLISGIIIGYSFFPGLKNPEAGKLKYTTVALVSICVILVSGTIYNKIPNDIGKYDEKMKSFTSLETSALAIFRLPETATKEEMLSAIQDSGIHNWNRNIVLLNEIKKLDLPVSLKERTSLLINYCNHRINSYRFMYKAIDENTGVFKDSIDYYNAKTEEIINSLNKEKPSK